MGIVLDFSLEAGNIRLKALADLLHTIPSAAFDINSIINMSSPVMMRRAADFIRRRQTPECGATGCAIGWAPTIFPELVWNEYGGVGFSPEVENPIQLEWHDGDTFHNVVANSFKVAAAFFYLSDRDASFLFMPNSYLYCNNDADEVASRIDAFVADRSISGTS